MRLMHPSFSSPIVLEEGRVNVLVAESPELYRSLLLDLTAQCAGQEGELILSRDFSVVPMSKNVALLREPLFPDFGSRKIVNSFLSGLEKTAMGDSLCTDTYNLQSALAGYFEKLLYAFDAPLKVDADVSVSALLKAANLQVDTEDSTPVERLSTWMEVHTSLRLANVFVFANLKSCFSTSELKKLYREIRLKKYRVLLLEPVLYDNLRAEECTLLFDADLCEVINETEN
ncbi:MAG: type II-A CRISPR-associated protein Csn2 [Oscillospiraceae bacterium]|nr:type II-A CRISPR-associated protein Csn2 [Oscillospiraceae bacterium]